MIRPTDSRRMLELLKRAFDEQPTPAGPHPLDDQVLISRWSTQRLSDAETDQLLDHLSLCPECREVLATLVECGVWELPPLNLNESDDDSAEESGAEAVDAKVDVQASQIEEVGRGPRRLSRHFGMWVALAALGIVAILAVPEVWKPSAGPQLALLEHQFTGDRLDRDLGYAFDGYSFTKGLFVVEEKPPAEERRLLGEYEQAIAEYPNHAALRAKYGELLLKLMRFDAASAEFSRALEIDATNAEANLGQGVIAFERKQLEAARAHFESALKQKPESEAARINLAITLEKLGMHEAALPHWREIESTTTDHKLREEIGEFLR